MEKEKAVSETRLSVRVSEEEKDLVRKIAGDYDLTITEFILSAVKYFAANRPKLIIAPKARSLASSIEVTG